METDKDEEGKEKIKKKLLKMINFIIWEEKEKYKWQINIQIDK